MISLLLQNAAVEMFDGFFSWTRNKWACGEQMQKDLKESDDFSRGWNAAIGSLESAFEEYEREFEDD